MNPTGFFIYGPRVKRDFVRHIEERANKKVGLLTMEKIDDIMKDVFCGTAAVETITIFMNDTLKANPKLLENAKEFVVTEDQLNKISEVPITNILVQGGGSRKRTFRHNRRTQKRRPSMKGGAPVDENLLETQLLQLLQRKLGHSSNPILSSPNPYLKNDADTTPKLTNLVTLLKGYGADSLEAVDKMAIKFQESMTTPRNMEMLKAIFECVLQNKFKRVLKEKLTVKLQEQVFYGHEQQTLNGIITDAINDENRINIIQYAFKQGNKSLKNLIKIGTTPFSERNRNNENQRREISAAFDIKNPQNDNYRP
jgi:hypothetical protein